MEFYDLSEDVVADYLSHSGEAKDIPDSEFDPVKLAVGVLVEVEHADDFDVAKEIAKDHLVEDGDYYGKYIFPDEAIERIEDEVVSYEDDPFRSGLADLPLSDDGPDPGLAYLSYDLPEDGFGFVDCTGLDCDGSPLEGDVHFEDCLPLEGTPLDLDSFEASDVVVITLGANWRQRLGQSLVRDVIDCGDHYKVGSGRLFSHVYFEVLDSHVRILPETKDGLHLFDSYLASGSCLVPVTDFRRILAGGSDGVSPLVSRIARVVSMHDGVMLCSTFDGESLEVQVAKGASPAELKRSLSSSLESRGYLLSDIGSLSFRPTGFRFKPLTSAESRLGIESARGAYIDPWRDLCLSFLQEMSSFHKVPKVANGVKKQIFGDDHIVYWYVEKLDDTYCCVEFHLDPTDGYCEVFVKDDYNNIVWDSFQIDDFEDYAPAEVDRADEAVLNRPASRDVMAG